MIRVAYIAEILQRAGWAWLRFAHPVDTGCTSPPFPLGVVIILRVTYCDPVRFMPSTSSHAIVVVVVVRIVIVSVCVLLLLLLRCELN